MLTVTAGTLKLPTSNGGRANPNMRTVCLDSLLLVSLLSPPSHPWTFTTLYDKVKPLGDTRVQLYPSCLSGLSNSVRHAVSSFSLTSIPIIIQDYLMVS